MPRASLDKIFLRRTQNIDSIFVSYRELYDMYVGVMRAANVRPTSIQAFEKAKHSADIKQQVLAAQLYSQGFVLLTGLAEALLKEAFESLILENFQKLTGVGGINFSIPELQAKFGRYMDDKSGRKIDPDDISFQLGSLTVEKLLRVKNPSEKVNFQNTISTKEAFRQYLGVNLDGLDAEPLVHRAWQVRHCIVHNNSAIDDRFIHNVKKVDQLRGGERKGATLNITKQDFQECKQAFEAYFARLESEVHSKSLRSAFIDIPF